MVTGCPIASPARDHRTPRTSANGLRAGPGSSPGRGLIEACLVLGLVVVINCRRGHAGEPYDAQEQHQVDEELNGADRSVAVVEEKPQEPGKRDPGVGAHQESAEYSISTATHDDESGCRQREGAKCQGAVESCSSTVGDAG